jgi:alpha/beta superfamily hydrolase
MPEVVINGPEGRIEGKYHHSESKNPNIALVLHPHPLYGGTMNNKVVYTMYHCLAALGFSVLRINFRGVGKSQGKFDDGIGELTDAATAFDWLQQHNPIAKNTWIAGFSFGSWVATQLLMRRPEIKRFILVSPPVVKYDFSFLSPCPTSGLVIQGNQDSVVKESDVSNFVNSLVVQKGIKLDYTMIGGADHFFREHIDELKDNISNYISLYTN